MSDNANYKHERVAMTAEEIFALHAARPSLLRRMEAALLAEMRRTGADSAKATYSRVKSFGKDSYSILIGGKCFEVGGWFMTERHVKKARRRRREVFGSLERFSRILPPKVHMEAFEPAYSDLKVHFLKERRLCKTKAEYRWWAFRVSLNVTFMIGNCFWVMFGDKLRRMILRLTPDLFRRLRGD